jgi:hypothetical protein
VALSAATSWLFPNNCEPDARGFSVPSRTDALHQTVFHSEGGDMADDLNEFDDPEQSYRRGYVHGAREVLAAIEQRLPADQWAMVETWLEGDLSKWRLENLRGKTGRNKTGLTGNMGPPRLLILD